ncbi:hypothetical protein ACFVIM_17000 [Streptomyces sp. NPDC057638]|uniref:hypothetical protein n=1 Tax=Streptomyces sp. NPDC057638 TaxID=3346190 RepID=UPI0036825AE6
MSTALLAGIARTTEPQSALRRVIALDAVVTGVNGLAYAVAPGPLGRLLGLDPDTLRPVGLFLVLYALAVAALAAAQRPPVPLVKLLVDVNLLWVVLSLVSLVLWFDPTAAGTVWIPLQALVVAGFAALQWVALRPLTR